MHAPNNTLLITCCKELNIVPILKTLPGDWRRVEPQETWPDTFFGHFPKTLFDRSEREREKRLNREVRFPLKKELENQATTTCFTDDLCKPKVQVLITCVCKYTPEIDTASKPTIAFVNTMYALLPGYDT